jgi:hypothetical protein
VSTDTLNRLCCQQAQEIRRLSQANERLLLITQDQHRIITELREELAKAKRIPVAALDAAEVLRKRMVEGS